ncbi:aminopeptidase N [Ferribacterium limneticum]|uniref:aminopeptidase N n=1 Tax=Ferribacterium limneticum TaxID=76259 RepID=UPI001CFB8E4B|nr:aminopeptidase N [Ferribacterium limneticum]UCV27985.1 aminopeptidase N [Ferribacterium limneticum]UCV31902.1 aminopeptidase N [Ferribacterium limneticum]
MKTDTPQTVYLKDYTVPAYLVDTVDLDFNIETGGTTVTATLAMRRNPAAASQPLILDGDELETLSVTVDGHQVPFAATASTLTISDLPESFTLQTVVRIDPDKNTRLSGLYRSADGYFTQCEAQGFRRITWFLDRPDVMSTYTVTLHADQATYPVLLANGNPVDAGQEANGRHWAKWADPFKKPAYLFAVVAGKLDVLKDTFKTASGRSVQLAIYVEPGKLDQCPHAMAALQKSMKWDEERFGLECDLDHYMIVAVGDFNMGAMENKGLNIFNTKYVLARSDVATDVDFENIDRVVAHEYFHNWTGNRVTCRDWFQLSLKEGLTVFRDQEFGADLHNRQTARIREVRGLRAAQFPEDAGPMAHPIRPASFVEINNFYTSTVYEKGAEVIRMIQTLIGRDGFRKGMDEYFRRHDGQAVTCEDFVAAMAAASGFDFTQFMRWYNQSGTPHVAADGYFDAESKTYTLTCTQSNTRASDEQPYLIPIRVALFAEDGTLLPGSERLLQMTATTQSFVFNEVSEEPVPSLLRDFSAPVTLDFDYTPEQLTLLLAHESDLFNAWEAGQRLASTLILDATAAIAAGQAPVWPGSFVDAARRLLQTQAQRGAAFVAEALTLPGESTLAEALDVVNPDALHAARNALRRHLAEQLEGEFSGLYAGLAPNTAYAPSSEQAGRRALRNVCLGYLLELDTPAVRQLALQQFRGADNMTDQFAALSVLANVNADTCPERDTALADFYARWQHEALVVDKWLAVQSTSRRPDTLATVKTLTAHPAFDIGNPNKVYSLIRAFGANLARFNAADGSAYAFIAERVIELHDRNPQVASRLARCFDRWKKFDASRQAHARAALESIRDHAGLSRDVLEVVTRSLGG